MKADIISILGQLKCCFDKLIAKLNEPCDGSPQNVNVCNPVPFQAWLVVGEGTVPTPFTGVQGYVKSFTVDVSNGFVELTPPYGDVMADFGGKKTWNEADINGLSIVGTTASATWEVNYELLP